MRTWVVAAVACSSVLALVPASLAAKNDPVVELRFTPTDAVGSSRAFLIPEVADRPVELSFEDARLAEDKRVLGDRTDDDDKLFLLTSKDDIAPYVRSVVERLARDWSVRVEEGAPRVLKLRLAGLEIVERNQAVGAMFNASVVLLAELSHRDGTVLWSGKSAGDASRYGKKFSNANVNEVQSDALKEALAALLNDSALQAAWSGRPAAPIPALPPADAAAAVSREPARSAAAPMSPAEMLEELKRMSAAGLEQDTLVAFVTTRQLSAPMTGSDAAAWKAAGIPEAVIRTALLQ